jgi:pimeloyl-ACP methyl ester carboxylesterase
MRRVLLLPGVVLPASLAYEALLEALGPQVEAIAKDLEVYADAEPPADYSLDTEVQGILRAADEAGFERFHLVGYSAGGAASLRFATLHPERLATLALLEAAWAGNDDLSDPEREIRDAAHRDRPPSELMAEFVRLQLAPGVDPPPPPDGPPPPWMAHRPAGIAAVAAAFERAELDLEPLRRARVPVYFALGGRSNPDYFARMADRLGAQLDDFVLDVFEDRHHFDPPHRIEPQRLAEALERHWARAS